MRAKVLPTLALICCTVVGGCGGVTEGSSDAPNGTVETTTTASTSPTARPIGNASVPTTQALESCLRQTGGIVKVEHNPIGSGAVDSYENVVAGPVDVLAITFDNDSSVQGIATFISVEQAQIAQRTVGDGLGGETVGRAILTVTTTAFRKPLLACLNTVGYLDSATEQKPEPSDCPDSMPGYFDVYNLRVTNLTCREAQTALAEASLDAEGVTVPEYRCELTDSLLEGATYRCEAGDRSLTFTAGG